MRDREDWIVSQTGGPKISGDQAGKILRVSKPQLYNYIKSGVLLRAEKRRRGMDRQPLVFFLADVVNLALEYGVVTQEQAEKLLHDAGNPKAAVVAA